MSRGYVVRRITLENIMSYEKMTLELSRGSLGLVGRNGAGKSTLLEALYTALTGGSTLRFGSRGPSSLLRRGQSSGRIEVTLAGPGGEELIAQVGIRRGGSAEYVIKARDSPGSPLKIVAARQGDYVRVLRERLGLGFPDSSGLAGFMKRAVIVPQGGLRSIAESMARPGSLREEIEAAIGLPEYRRTLETLDRGAIVSVEDGEGTPRDFRLGPRRLREVQQRLTQVEDKKRALEAEVRSLLGEKERLSTELSEVERRLEELRGKKERLQREAAGLEVEEKRLEELKRRLEEARRELEETRGRLEEARRAGEERRRLEPLYRLHQRLPQLREAEKSLVEKRMERDRLERLLGLALGWGEASSRVEELKGAEERLEEAQRRHREVQREYSMLKALVERLEEEQRSLEKGLQKTLEALGRLGREVLGNLTNVPGEVLGGLEKTLEEAQRELEHKLSSEAELSAQLRVRERSLQALREHRENRCPLCGSPLDEEHRSRAMQQLELEVAELQRKLESLQVERAELEKRLKILEEALSEAKREANRLEELKTRLDEVRGELERARARLSGSEKALEEATRELRDAELLYRRLVEASREERLLRAQLEQSGLDVDSGPEAVVDELRKRIGVIEEEISRLEGMVRVFEEEARSLGFPGLGEALEALQGVGERYAELRVLEEERPRLEALVGRLEEEVGELEETVKVLEERVRRLPLLRETMARVEKELGELEARRGEAEEALRRVEGELSAREARVQELAREARVLHRAEALLRAGLAVRSALEQMMRHLYRRSLRLLEREMSSVLETFDLDPYRVEIREEGGQPHLVVHTRSQAEAQVPELSGGEKSALALAYVVALNRIMGARVGFLALDEPTSELDDERRRALVHVLSTLSRRSGAEAPLDQLIVVTHHNEVSDSVDVVCRVSKEAGRSVVTCNEPL